MTVDPIADPTAAPIAPAAKIEPWPRAPRQTDGSRAAAALTVDVEEWYHTCLVPEYVDPARRPALVEELDWLLPELLALLADADCRATFFVLGEVAQRLPQRVREVAAAGHEIASHGYLHLRVGERTTAEFVHDLRRAKDLLEQVVGRRVDGYRAPEWSLRTPDNPRLRCVAEAGFRYDSSLAPVLGAGRWSNPRHPYTLRWSDGIELAELPPLTFAGPCHLPAGSWPGRLASARWIAAAARRQAARGGLPVMVFHPWEVSDRPTPGRLTGVARFIHETGRRGYRAQLTELLRRLAWRTLAEEIVRAPAPAPLAVPTRAGVEETA
jgi:polysaccharide deacetylase family protein (PEP-CTERM system associated)